MTVDPNPESTWGATPEYIAAWNAQYGSADAKAMVEAEAAQEAETAADDFVKAGGDPATLNTDIQAVEQNP